MGPGRRVQLRDRVITATPERAAAHHPARTEIETPKNTMALDRLESVGAAGGVEATRVGPKRSVLSVPIEHGQNNSLHTNQRSAGRA